MKRRGRKMKGGMNGDEKKLFGGKPAKKGRKK